MVDKPLVECVADVQAVLGEGPIWVAREAALYWVDIKGRKIFRLKEEQVIQWPTPMRVGSIAPRAGGGFIGGTEHGIAMIDLEEGRFDIVCDPEARIPDNRFNDGKVDRSGRFWAGTMDDCEAEARGTLYCLDAALDCIAKDSGYRVTNGPAFSPEGSLLYHNDSALQRTYVFDLDVAANLLERREFLRFGAADGYPDGMTVDAEGCLWIAFWDGGCVRRFSPGGEWLQEIDLPVSRPTSCAFGGPDLDQLFVTSARIGLGPEKLATEPQAGGLFRLTPGIRGVAEVPFAG